MGGERAVDAIRLVGCKLSKSACRSRTNGWVSRECGRILTCLMGFVPMQGGRATAFECVLCMVHRDTYRLAGELLAKETTGFACRGRWLDDLQKRRGQWAATHHPKPRRGGRQYMYFPAVVAFICRVLGSELGRGKKPSSKIVKTTNNCFVVVDIAHLAQAPTGRRRSFLFYLGPGAIGSTC